MGKAWNHQSVAMFGFGFRVFDVRRWGRRLADGVVEAQESDLMREAEMKERPEVFALRVRKLVDGLANARLGRRIGDPLLRAGISVGSNDRAGCLGRSKAKLGVAEEGADEAALGMEVMIGAGLMPKGHVGALLDEANPLRAVLVALGKISGGLR